MGIEVARCRLAALTYADDVAVLVSSLKELQMLIGGFLEFCRLAGFEVSVPKTQVWSSQPGGVTAVAVGGAVVPLSQTLKMVGLVLGGHERVAARLHSEPRLVRARAAAERIGATEVPLHMAAVLWWAVVLPQFVSGCEARVVPRQMMGRLAETAGMLGLKRAPLQLSGLRAAEVALEPPLGAAAVRHPELEVLLRTMRWLHPMANCPGLVGIVHRGLAMHQGRWVEPTAAFRKAFERLGWHL